MERMENDCLCVLCGKPYMGRGHDPEPLANYGRCCDVCNTAHVIPAKILKLALGGKNETTKKTKA